MTVEEWLGEDNQLGIDIMTKKYLQPGEDFEQWLNRVSGRNEKIKDLIRAKKFLFGGRILSNRGVKSTKTTYSNCYVITPPNDDIESIYDSRKKLARTYSYGGGCGIDLSKLSPRGAKVNNQAKETTGAVSFMQGYSQTTEEIGQNGRRGALMISLSCEHPDLEEFIDCKANTNAVTKANISVRVTDEFMKAVIEDKPWTMAFFRPETGETITKTVNAKKLFHKLAENNWNYAEPGILFWDRIESWNLLSNNPEFEYAGVNPCAEEPLPAGGSCLLGSMNLSEYVLPNKTFDFSQFQIDVMTAVEGLNEVLEEGLPLHPLEEQRKSVSDWRQIGLGIMGLADMLIKMEIPYDSSKALRVCDAIGAIMADQAIYASSVIAHAKGVYPKYSSKVIDTKFFEANAAPIAYDSVETYGLRNSQLLTVAPTGTLSSMLGISGGIEPVFANSYTRKTESLHNEDVYYKVYTPIVKKYMEEHGLTDDSQLPEWFVTAETIDPFKRIEMQAVWQKHIDASISSTINLPESATVDEVEQLYMYAWQQGLKGLTIFRNGCKRQGILTTGDESNSDNTKETPTPALSTQLQRGDIINCSDDLVGKKRKITSGCGPLHVLAYFDPINGKLMEVYLNKGSQGGCANFMTGLSRTISLLCRAGVDVFTIKDQLDSTGSCPSYAVRSATKHDTSKGSCCPMAVGNALIDMWKEMQDEIDDVVDDATQAEDSGHEITRQSSEKAVSNATQDDFGGKCPECGGELMMTGGCILCKSCGWSRCD